MDEARLKSIPLFASLSKHELREVARCADEVDVREGKSLMTEGEFAFEFFVIEDGTSEVTHGGRRVAQLGRCDFLGEMGAIEHAKRSASVVATSPMTLIVMTDRDIRHLEHELPAVHQRLCKAIEERTAALAGAAN
jgi:voltage-gated potassium channel